ncbi:MAG: carboxypeptidase-like regulatory domain-containing protein [Fimbriimonadaceae bacterium]
MRVRKSALAWFAIWLAITVAGCGGQGGPGDDSRGEGNIPVGKVVDPDAAPARIVVMTSTRRRIEAFSDATGQVYMPQLPPGPSSFTVYPLDSTKQVVSFGIVSGENQAGIFHMFLLDESISVDPETIQGNFRDQTILVKGEKRELQFTLSKPLGGNLGPSYWVSGGKAAIRDGVIVGIEPGQGVLTVAYGQASKSFRFSVVGEGK